MTTPLISSVALTRDFPGVRALAQVDFDLKHGEVHLLFGENGAGKSTLIALLSGALTPTSGEIFMEGEPIVLPSVHAARQYGISAVFQEFSLVEELSIQDNLFLGDEICQRGFLDRKSMHDESIKILEELGFALDPQRRVETLSRAEQQMVEIAKAFRTRVSVLILDEPTASLSDHEASRLFALIGKLKERSVGVIYITHRMSELHEIGDRVTVLRDGHKIATRNIAKTSDSELIQMMTGRKLGAIFPKIDRKRASSKSKENILEVDRLSTRGGEVTNISMQVAKGEILGLAGLAGSGKSAAMEAVFGLLPLSHGRVTFKGKDMTNKPPKEKIRCGMLYLPADRKNEGLMMQRSAGENMQLLTYSQTIGQSGLFLDKKSEAQNIDRLAKRFNLAPNKPARVTHHFSGGNQQKIMLARSIAEDFDLLIFNDPTVGVDVGTRALIYQFIADLAKAGVSIIIISSDLVEVLGLASRVIVFSQGQIKAELSGKEMTEQNVLTHFFAANEEKECA